MDANDGRDTRGYSVAGWRDAFRFDPHRLDPRQVRPGEFGLTALQGVCLYLQVPEVLASFMGTDRSMWLPGSVPRGPLAPLVNRSLDIPLRRLRTCAKCQVPGRHCVFQKLHAANECALLPLKYQYRHYES